MRATANPPKSDDRYAQLTPLGARAFMINDFLQNPQNQIRLGDFFKGFVAFSEYTNFALFIL